MYRQSEKNLLNSNISSTCANNMANFGLLAATFLLAGLGHPSKFQQGFASWLRYCSEVVHRRPTKLCTMFGPLLVCYIIYRFSAAFVPDGISPSAKFTLRSSLAFSYIGSVTAQHYSSGVSQTLRRGTRNGITELSQRAPLIFGWAAITLGIAHILVLIKS